MKRSTYCIFVLGISAIVPAMGQNVDPSGRVSRGGPSTNPPPTTVNPTPPPAPPTQPPPPAPPPPPVTTPPPIVYTAPVTLGSSTSLPSLESVFSELNHQIAVYNGAAPIDLPGARLSGASQTILPVVTNSSSSGTPSAPQTDPSGRTTRGGSTPPPAPPPSTTNQIQLDVTGWSYLVLQWGDTNYHFYVGSSTGMQTFTGSMPLSSYAFFSAASQAATTETISVADSGSSITLLTSGLFGLGLLYPQIRRLKTRKN